MIRYVAICKEHFMLIPSPNLSQVKTTLTEKIFLGNEPTPELLAILTVYFVQGILGLARLAVSFFLKDELNLSPAQVAALMGIAALPWVIKPVFGFLSDSLPILGYRRRSYIIFSGLLGTVSWLAMATVVDSAITATLAILLSSLSVAISDVIVDSLVVIRIQQQSQKEAGSLQSLCWGASALGGLITAYISGSLLEQFSTQVVFGITASFPLLVSCVAMLIHEQRVSDRPNFSTVRHQTQQLWQGMKQKAIWLPTLFLFIWQSTPTADSAFFFFTTNELGFTPEFLGRVRLVTSLASLVGVAVFQRYLRHLSFRLILGWSTVIAAALGMTTLLLVTHTNRLLGIDDHWFSLGDSLILTVIGQITFMPVLVLSAKICPPGVEATFFALLMSIWNLGGLLSHESGALLTHALGVTDSNFDNLWILVVITNLTTLIPLPFLGWLPHGTEEMDAADIPNPEPEMGANHPPKSPVLGS